MSRTIFSIAYNNNNNNNNNKTTIIYIFLLFLQLTVTTIFEDNCISKTKFLSFSLLSHLINAFYDAHTPFILCFLQTLIFIRIRFVSESEINFRIG
jgi:hypothetical protein